MTVINFFHLIIVTKLLVTITKYCSPSQFGNYNRIVLCVYKFKWEVTIVQRAVIIEKSFLNVLCKLFNLTVAWSGNLLFEIQSANIRSWIMVGVSSPIVGFTFREAWKCIIWNASSIFRIFLSACTLCAVHKLVKQCGTLARSGLYLNNTLCAKSLITGDKSLHAAHKSNIFGSLRLTLFFFFLNQHAHTEKSYFVHRNFRLFNM